MVHVKGFQPFDDVVGGFPGHVGGDFVAGRVDGGTGVHHDMGDAGFTVQDIEYRATQIHRRYDA
ncbi:uncharacterized protein RMCFA_3140 [Mycolicibacterium fortuitum subsp. acetamidolyticum]|uniref:Uncharacterized protein n=1 Tax=Mycolicibacterium fortuitum subsp. acetamidolyticum TaxID=144550 RepID=A0A100WR22_MYCFO|nr:uncharacterized protein RMCFA_3140 [Mycolicibacterium fortuitum subsp. acetamidolyticum]